MKKKKLIMIGLLAVMISAAGCGKTTQTEESSSKEAFAPSVIIPDSSEESTSAVPSSTEDSGTQESSAEEEPETAPAGMYRSELTNEWIPDTLQNQRPIAVMVDNEKTALDHYGVNQADIVYEMMNSTKNNRITRLMVVMKDWAQITQLGSIRSVRPTNFMIAAEYNAILCHDGGPWYIDYYANDDPYTKNNNLSGGFARFPNGKKREYTEYITYNAYTNPSTGESFAGLAKRIENAKYSTTYTESYPGKHFKFSREEFTLSETNYNTKTAVDVDLPFPHNESELKYNETTKTYDYYVYGSAHIDALDGEITTFKNVILQSCDYVVFDTGGYMKYYVVTENPATEKKNEQAALGGALPDLAFYSDPSDGTGYYITNGEAIRITWTKDSEADITVFRNANTGEEITLNTGKTYIAIVPSDYWDQLVIK